MLTLLFTLALFTSAFPSAQSITFGHSQLGMRYAIDERTAWIVCEHNERNCSMTQIHTLRQLREKRGFTQEGLAGALNLSDRTVRSWETDPPTKPMLGTRLRLAKVLNISLDALNDLLEGRAITISDDGGSIGGRTRGLSVSDMEALEEIGAKAVCAAGAEAIRHFQIPTLQLRGDVQERRRKADAACAMSGLRALLPELDTFTSNRDRRYIAYGEDFGLVLEQFRPNDSLTTDASVFARNLPVRVGALCDFLDGTWNAIAGVPFFCNAIAFFDGPFPCVGVVGDPVRNLVYSGWISVDGTKRKARVSHPPSSLTIDLVAGCAPEQRNLAIHLSRTKHEKRSELQPILDWIADKNFFHSRYQFNCGQLALAMVAAGSVAFCTNATNIWDTAAGDVIIRASGESARITDLFGNPIAYDQGHEEVGVLAAADEATHDFLSEAVRLSVR